MKKIIDKLQKLFSIRKIILVFVAFVIAVYAPTQFISSPVYADKYDDQINALKQSIESYQQQIATLNAEAKTLQSALAVLAAEQAQIQAQIDVSQTKYDQLIIKIAETEKQIADNKDALGITIANLYVDDNITPIEMLFGSKNISDYMDKQEYRNSVRDELATTISKIKDLKIQLDIQKVDVEKVLADQKSQKDDLAAKQNEQQALLNETNGQEAAYKQLTSKSDEEISKLRAQQAADNAARARSNGGNFTSLPGDGSRGGYPAYWMSLPLDGTVDFWGMYTRECTSYAAFKVDQAYGNMPYWGGRGNANQWPADARAAGIKTSSTPAAGTVGVVSSGTFGHVAWVESVNDNGTINISHFNIGWNGDYAEWYNLDASFFDTYIYFGG